MSASVEFLLRLLEQAHPPHLAQEDFDGEHGAFLRACQAVGFVTREPVVHPTPSCHHCGEGVPYRLGKRHLCNRCGSTVDPRRLRAWPVDLGGFLRWLAGELHLCGEVRPLDDVVWRLGTHKDEDGACECFYCSGRPMSDQAAERLTAYRNAVVLYGLRRPPRAVSLPATFTSLVNVLGLADSLVAVARWSQQQGGLVRFDRQTGRVEVGGAWCGEVSPGTREHAFLACLARHQARFVPYADIKREVLRASGGRDSQDEASFCHRLKSRIKRKYVPTIDVLLKTSNRSDGYLLLSRKAP
jgi:hypothetical protein